MLLRFPDLPHAGRSEVMVSIGTTSPENNAHAPSAGIGGIPVGRTGELGGSQCNVRHAAAPFFFSASAKSTALTTWISTYVKGKAIKILICAAHAVNLIYQRPPPHTELFIVDSVRILYAQAREDVIAQGLMQQFFSVSFPFVRRAVLQANAGRGGHATCLKGRVHPRHRI